MRERILRALRQVAQQQAGAMPSPERVASAAGVDEETVFRYLGPAENFAALLSYQSGLVANAPVDTRDRILQSASRVFASKGLQKATLDEVATDAGMTKGAIYWHFRSKNDLFFALLDDRFRECTSPLQGELDQVMREAMHSNPMAALAQMFKASLERCSNDPEWPRLYFECVAQTRDPEVRQRLADFYERGWAMSRDLTNSLKAMGLAPAEADADVAAIFWGALFDGLVLAWMINPEKMDMDRLADGIFRMLWRGIAPESVVKRGE